MIIPCDFRPQISHGGNINSVSHFSDFQCNPPSTSHHPKFYPGENVRRQMQHFPFACCFAALRPASFMCLNRIPPRDFFGSSLPPLHHHHLAAASTTLGLFPSPKAQLDLLAAFGDRKFSPIFADFVPLISNALPARHIRLTRIMIMGKYFNKKIGRKQI